MHGLLRAAVAVLAGVAVGAVFFTSIYGVPTPGLAALVLEMFFAVRAISSHTIAFVVVSILPTAITSITDYVLLTRWTRHGAPTTKRAAATAATFSAARPPPAAPSVEKPYDLHDRRSG